MASPYPQNKNLEEDWVIFEVEDMENGHVQLIVAADVVQAASAITKEQGPKLRGYKRIAYIDRRPMVSFR